MRKRLVDGLQKAFAGLCTLLLLVPSPATGANAYNYSNKEINQQDSMGYGSNNYYNGSDDSKDEGVRNGMRAMNRLASLDIGGAIHYGYKGYGNYVNSQKMDDLDERAWKLKGVMNSASNSMIKGAKGNGTDASQDSASILGPERENAKLAQDANGERRKNGESSITRRLSDMDKSFLYRGETGEVAAEFEKRSGMSREEFFDHVAAAEASGLNWDDPNVLDKMEKRYQAFVARIPNKEFRGNIEKAHNLFSLAKKTALLEEGMAFYTKMRWGDGAAPQQVANSDVTGNVSSLSSSSNENVAKSDSADRSPASEAMPVAVHAKTEDMVPRLTKEQMGMYLGLEGAHGDELKDIMLNAEDSIFRLVSKRYRKITPALFGKAVVIDAK